VLEFLFGVLITVIIITIVGRWWRVWRPVLKWAGIITGILAAILAVFAAVFVSVAVIGNEASGWVQSTYPSVAPLPLFTATSAIILGALGIAFAVIVAVFQCTNLPMPIKSLSSDTMGWVMALAMIFSVSTILLAASIEAKQMLETYLGRTNGVAATPVHNSSDISFDDLIPKKSPTGPVCSETIKTGCWAPDNDSPVK
jgi:hypothetical protein